MSFTLAANAQTLNETTFTMKPVFNYTPGKYKGLKANNDPNNPCKGWCILTCAKIKTDTSTKLEDTFSTNNLQGRTSINQMVWMVPTETSETDYQAIKALENKYCNLQVVRGIDDDGDDDE